MDWAYGVTTVPSRKTTLFSRTLDSLEKAGFPNPRLFIDGLEDPTEYDSFGLERTTHYPTINTVNNWILSLWELYGRNPKADRFAIFQDDFVTYRNLREYLEQCPYPKEGYWNLYSFPVNERLAKGQGGWHLSNQLGKGAVALVFDRAAVLTLLSANHISDRIQNKSRGHKCIDGAILESMKQANYKEYVHMPSLVQHTGVESSMGSRKHKFSTSFRGEDFDVLELLK